MKKSVVGEYMSSKFEISQSLYQILAYFDYQGSDRENHSNFLTMHYR